MQNKEIADLLGVSIDTVKFHLRECLRKLAIIAGIDHPCRIDLAVWTVRVELADQKKQTRRLMAA